MVGFFSRNLVLAVAVLHLVGKRVETQVSLRVQKGIPRRACMAIVVFRDKIVEISADTPAALSMHFFTFSCHRRRA